MAQVFIQRRRNKGIIVPSPSRQWRRHYFAILLRYEFKWRRSYLDRYNWEQVADLFTMV